VDLTGKENKMSDTVLSVEKVSKAFKKQEAQQLTVLENVNLTLQEGEIVALLGKSGSGKSTLLRIIAGLTAPSSGNVKYRGHPVKEPVPDISMVFQSFALMPWLTAQQNVELGLEAKSLPKKERQKQAVEAIDMVGLDGFEKAYPRELSGGMQQRVGFARALVRQPDLLLMDEPFSSLDILTAENLRDDLLELWEKNEQMKSILYVTHSIEEAVLTADRIIIFGSNPGFIRGELKVDLPTPRSSSDIEVEKIIDEVYHMLTTAETTELKERMNKRQALTIGYRLPEAEVAELTGLLNAMHELKDHGVAIDLPELSENVRLNVDDLFPILEVLSVLGLANVSEGDVTMTNLGRKLIEGDIDSRKQLFAKILQKKIPLAKHVVKVLQERQSHQAHESRFLNELEDHFTYEEARRVFGTFIKWARYAEIIDYDANAQMITLDPTNIAYTLQPN
jgi:NitT/TauT family transport system ATP-binding protein